MAIKLFKKKNKNTSTTLDAGIGSRDAYQGPVQQGTSETVFRKTGTTTTPTGTKVTSTTSQPSGVGTSTSRSSGGSSKKIVNKPSSQPQSTLETPTEAATFQINQPSVQTSENVLLQRKTQRTPEERALLRREEQALIDEGREYSRQSRSSAFQRQPKPFSNFTQRRTSSIEEIPEDRSVYALESTTLDFPQSNFNADNLFTDSTQTFKPSEYNKSSSEFVNKAATTGRNVYNFLSVGGLTYKDLNKQQETLNKDIETFNIKYTNSSLEGESYDKAVQESISLTSRQMALDTKREQFYSTPGYKASNFIFGTGALGVNQQEEKVYAGTLPLTPATSFTAPVKNIKFVGTQKVSGSTIATNLIYTNSGKVGVASGITKTGSGTSVTISGGKQGIAGINFPSGKNVIGRTDSFVSTGFSKEVYSNDIIKSVGVGSSASVKGDKLINTFVKFPSGKISTKVNPNVYKDSFISVSAAKQQGDYFKIIGLSKGVKGSRARFSGIIKTTSSGDDITRISSGGYPSSQQLQSAALDTVNKAIGGAASVGTKTKSITGFTARTGSVENVPSASVVSSNQLTSVKLAPKVSSSMNLNSVISSGTTSSTVSLSLPKINSGSRSKTIVRQKSISAQLPTITPANIVQQASAQKQGLRQQQILIQKPIQVFRPFVVSNVPRFITPFALPRIKVSDPLPKSKGSFAVFGRRFGKFRLVGYGKTEGEAVEIGKDFASQTLGATFKIPGAKTEVLPGYKTKYSKKEGKVFIQLPKYRLSTGSEKKEIKMFKALKGGRKRR